MHFLPGGSVPPYIAEAVKAQAELDANRVAICIEATASFLSVSLESLQSALRPATLVDLAGAMQLLAWDRAGLTAHVDSGLPSGAQALMDTWLAALDEPQRLPKIMPHVSRFRFDHGAWDARSLIGADVLVGDLDVDDVADGIVQFLLNIRINRK